MKLISSYLAFTLIFSLLVGCGSKEETVDNTEERLEKLGDLVNEHEYLDRLDGIGVIGSYADPETGEYNGGGYITYHMSYSKDFDWTKNAETMNKIMSLKIDIIKNYSDILDAEDLNSWKIGYCWYADKIERFSSEAITYEKDVVKNCSELIKKD